MTLTLNSHLQPVPSYRVACLQTLASCFMESDAYRMVLRQEVVKMNVLFVLIFPRFNQLNKITKAIRWCHMLNPSAIAPSRKEAR